MGTKMIDSNNVSWCSFDTWSQKGYRVKKGEKSILRCPLTNIPLFHFGQVSILHETPMWDEACEADIY